MLLYLWHDVVGTLFIEPFGRHLPGVLLEGTLPGLSLTLLQLALVVGQRLLDDVGKLGLVGRVENDLHRIGLKQFKEFFHRLQQIARQHIGAVRLLETAQQRSAVVYVDTAHLTGTSGKLVLVLLYVDNAYFILEHDILRYFNT